MRQSIFDRVVLTENSYTQLFCNLMERSLDFKKVMVELLFSPQVAERISAHTFETQVTLRGTNDKQGRPDIYRDAPDVILIVEVKTASGTPATDLQSWSHDESENLRGYLTFLKSKAATDRWFVYLVPSDWFGIDKLHETQREHDFRDGIRLKVVTWESIFTAIDESLILDPFIEEFKLLLSRRFEPISLTQSEVKMPIEPETLKAVWKLTKLIRSISEKAKSAGFSVEWERDWRGESEGFYFKRGKSYLLYFGSWPEFTKVSRMPLCMGVSDAWENHVTQCFLAHTPFEIVHFADPKKWTMTSIPENLVTSDDAAAKIWESIRTVVTLLNRESTVL